LAESDGSRRFSSGLLFEIAGSVGCIESRERSGDGLLRLNHPILACVGQVLSAATAATLLTCFTGARPSSPLRAGEARAFSPRVDRNGNLGKYPHFASRTHETEPAAYRPPGP